MRDRNEVLELLLSIMGSEMYLSAVFHPINFPELTYEDLANHPDLTLACSLQCKSEYVYRRAEQERLYGPKSESELDFSVKRATVFLSMRDGTKKEVPCITIGDYAIHKAYSRSYGITHRKTGLALLLGYHDLNQSQCKQLLITVVTACNKRGIDPVTFRSHDDQIFVTNLMRSTAEELKRKK